MKGSIEFSARQVVILIVMIVILAVVVLLGIIYFDKIQAVLSDLMFKKETFV